jgi:chromosome segregation ATPase
MEEEIFEGLGGLSMDLSQMAEVLFDQLQKTMLSLVKKYEIEEGDLKSSFDVIEKLWELLQETQSSYEMYKEKLSELEEQWNEEKEKIRAIEKVCTLLVMTTAGT